MRQRSFITPTSPCQERIAYDWNSLPGKSRLIGYVHVPSGLLFTCVHSHISFLMSVPSLLLKVSGQASQSYLKRNAWSKPVGRHKGQRINDELNILGRSACIANLRFKPKSMGSACDHGKH